MKHRTLLASRAITPQYPHQQQRRQPESYGPVCEEATPIDLRMIGRMIEKARTGEMRAWRRTQRLGVRSRDSDVVGTA